ncbi:MAG: nucleoside monophosphate kinase [Candidatus Omnitrophica bacterium]|nr:nucleoside monophosphate kinase [Candidatus Omnitrophota bacterium]
MLHKSTSVILLVALAANVHIAPYPILNQHNIFDKFSLAPPTPFNTHGSTLALDSNMFSHGKAPLFILVGMPASGKGTIGRAFAGKLGIPFVSQGEVLRENYYAKGGKQAGLTKSGVLNQYYQEHIPDVSDGLIFDINYPSPLKESPTKSLQAFMRRHNLYLAGVIHIKVDESTSRARLEARSREADLEVLQDGTHRIDRRLRNHYDNVVPRIDFFRSRGLLIEVDNNTTGEIDRKADVLVSEVKKTRAREIAQSILRELNTSGKNKLVVGLCGTSGVGKTSIADEVKNMLNSALGNEATGILHQDMFFHTDDEVWGLGIAHRSSRAGLDVEHLCREISNFNRNRRVVEPKLVIKDSRGQRKRTGETEIKAKRILIVDGGFIYANNTPSYRKLLNLIDYRIFLDASMDILKNWWIDRSIDNRRRRGVEESEEDARSSRTDKWNSSISKFVERDRSLMKEADLVVFKGKDHVLDRLVESSILARGTCIAETPNIDTYPSPKSVVAEALDDIREKVNAGGIWAEEALRELEYLFETDRIRSFDGIAKSNDDYMAAFIDNENGNIALAYEFYLVENKLKRALPRALLYLALSRISSVDLSPNERKQIVSRMFSVDDMLLLEELNTFLDLKTSPNTIQVNSLSTDDIVAMDNVGDKKSLRLARSLLAELGGKKKTSVAFISPTDQGGGIAEVRYWLTAILGSDALDIPVKWISLIRHENPDYSGISGASIKSEKKDTHKRAMAQNIEGIDLTGYRYVFVDDCYTLGLIPLIRKRYPNIKIIWVQHASNAKRLKFEFARHNLTHADLAIAWKKSFLPNDLDIPMIEMPVGGIDPIGYKSCEISQRMIAATLEKYNMDCDREKRPLLIEVARFNTSKDHLASITAFRLFKKHLEKTNSVVKPQLAILGIPMAKSDWKLYNELKAYVDNLGDPDIHIVAMANRNIELTTDQEAAIKDMDFDPDRLSGIDLNALEINAFQRAAVLALHPASGEAFGLSITEALWKKTPVLATKVGGIPLQVLDEDMLIKYNETGKSESYSLLRNGNFEDLTPALEQREMSREMANRIIRYWEKRNTKDAIQKREAEKRNIQQQYMMLQAATNTLLLMWLLDAEARPSIFKKKRKVSINEVKELFLESMISGLNKKDSRVLEEDERLLRPLAETTDDVIQNAITRLCLLRKVPFTFQRRLQLLLGKFGRKAVAPILEAADTDKQFIRERLYWALIYIGEDAIEDLSEAALTSESPFVREIAVRALARLGYTGNRIARQTIRQYIQKRGWKSFTYRAYPFRKLEHATFDAAGQIAITIAEACQLDEKAGDKIAALLFSEGIYPAPRLVASIRIAMTNNKKSILSNVKKKKKEWERRIDALNTGHASFDRNDDIDVDLGYTILARQAERSNLWRFDLTYKAYRDWIDSIKPSKVVLSGARNIESKRDAELRYLAYEAELFRTQFLEIAKRKARMLGRELVVIPNLTYGEIALSPIEEKLQEDGIPIMRVRQSSDKCHYNPFLVDPNLFSDQDLLFILKKKPIIVVADGTNSVRGQVMGVSGKARKRDPHYPDAYQGYRNFLIALEDILRKDVRNENEGLDFYTDEAFIDKLRATPAYRRLQQRITNLVKHYNESIDPQEKPILIPRNETPYSMAFWKPGHFPLYIRQLAKPVDIPMSIDPENIEGPTCIFAEIGIEKEAIPGHVKWWGSGLGPYQLDDNLENIPIPKHPLVEHDTAYHDLDLRELGFSNFLYRLSLSDRGPNLEMLFEDNKKKCAQYAHSVREMRWTEPLDDIKAKKARTTISEKKQVILFVGKPGSHKTTLGRKMAEYLAIQHISLGEIMRATEEENPAFRNLVMSARGPMRKAQKWGRQNAIRTIGYGLLENHLRENARDSHAVVIDAPTILEDDFVYLNNVLSGMGFEVGLVVHLDITDDVAAKNIQGRKARPSSIERAKRRLAYYKKFGPPILDYYRRRGVMLDVDTGERQPDEEFSYCVDRISDWVERRINNIPELHRWDNIHRLYHFEELWLIRREADIRGKLAKFHTDHKNASVRKNPKLFNEWISLLIELNQLLKTKSRFVQAGHSCRHSHTNYDGDDGAMSTRELVNHAVNNGITTLYVTGHNTVKPSIQAIRTVSRKSSPFILETRPGVEIEAPFETEAGDPFCFMHWRVTGPVNKAAIDKMNELVEEIDQKLEGFLELRFEKVLSLADKRKFDRAVSDDVLERFIKRSRVKRYLRSIGISITDKEAIRLKLLELFKDIRAFVDSHPRYEFMPRLLNKLNVIGAWTEEIEVWDGRDPKKGETRSIRRCLRELLDIVYTDKDTEDDLKKRGEELPVRAGEAIRWFTDIGCRVITAHPDLEIGRGEGQITESLFIKNVAPWVKMGYLHGMGCPFATRRNWGNRLAQKICKAAGVSPDSFKVERNNTDFHGKSNAHILLGDRHGDKAGRILYWSMDGEASESRATIEDDTFMGSYFSENIDTLFLEGDFINALYVIEKLLTATPFCQDTEALLMKLFDNHGFLRTFESEILSEHAPSEDIANENWNLYLRPQTAPEDAVALSFSQIADTLDKRNMFWHFENKATKERAKTRITTLGQSLESILNYIDSLNPGIKSDLIAVYVTGSYPWADEPGDIDLHLIVQDGAGFRKTGINRNKIRGITGGELDIDVSVQIINAGELNQPEGNNGRSIFLKRKQLLLYENGIHVWGRDIYESSHLPPVSFQEGFALEIVERTMAKPKVYPKRARRLHEADLMLKELKRQKRLIEDGMKNLNEAKKSIEEACDYIWDTLFNDILKKDLRKLDGIMPVLVDLDFITDELQRNNLLSEENRNSEVITLIRRNMERRIKVFNSNFGFKIIVTSNESKNDLLQRAHSLKEKHNNKPILITTLGKVAEIDASDRISDVVSDITAISPIHCEQAEGIYRTAYVKIPAIIAFAVTKALIDKSDFELSNNRKLMALARLHNIITGIELDLNDPELPTVLDDPVNYALKLILEILPTPESLFDSNQLDELEKHELKLLRAA